MVEPVPLPMFVCAANFPTLQIFQTWGAHNAWLSLPPSPCLFAHAANLPPPLPSRPIQLAPSPSKWSTVTTYLQKLWLLVTNAIGIQVATQT